MGNSIRTLKLKEMDDINLNLGFVEAALDAVNRIASTSGEMDIKPETISHLVMEANRKMSAVKNILK